MKNRFILIISLLIGLQGCNQANKVFGWGEEDDTGRLLGAALILSSMGVPAPGSPDLGFNGTGYVVYDGGGYRDLGMAVTADTSGNIVVTGFTSYSTINERDMITWRFRSDGIPDGDFGGGGVVRHNNAAGGNGLDQGQGIAMDDNGHIVVAGDSYGSTATRDMALWRLKADGTLDTGFNGKGYQTHHNAAGGASDDWASAIMNDGVGRIVASGFSRKTVGSDAVVWRYNSNGTLDPSLNGTGYKTLDSGYTGFTYGPALAEDEYGRILVGGYSDNGSNDDAVIWRLFPDGSLDSGFASAGLFIYDGGGYDNFISVTVSAEGKIIVCGRSDTNPSGTANLDLALWRFNEDGSPDLDFGNNGVVFYDNGDLKWEECGGIVLDAAGRIIVAGSVQNLSGTHDLAVWRYLPDGTPDLQFASNGISVHNGAAGGDDDDHGYGVALDEFGRILVTGMSTDANGKVNMATWRFNP